MNGETATPQSADHAIAFAMRCDEQGMTYEAGVEAAERLCDEIMAAAENRDIYAEREEPVE